MSNKITSNDFREKQSLDLFKNWLAKHQFLKYTGEEDIDDLLMCYLRVKKFSMSKAYESIEFLTSFIKLHPDWYSNPSPADYEFTDKPNSPIIFLKNLDAEGRRIYIYRVKYFENFDTVEFYRQNVLTPMLFCFDMHAQQNGIVMVVDYTDVNLKKFTKVPIQRFLDGFQLSKFGVMRVKQMNIIGMPLFLKPIYEIGKKLTSSKVIQRFNFINDVKELSKHMDVSVLPEEFGGTSNELLDYATFELGIAFVKKILKFDVNENKVQERENVGSFRKLEID